jgi:hypothetical protein
LPGQILNDLGGSCDRDKMRGLEVGRLCFEPGFVLHQAGHPYRKHDLVFGATP